MLNKKDVCHNFIKHNTQTKNNKYGTTYSFLVKLTTNTEY